MKWTLKVALLCFVVFITQFAIAASVFPRSEGECLTIVATHSSYENAMKKLLNVLEVRRWKKSVEKNDRHIAWLPNSDSTVFHEGECFWEINLYEDAGEQLIRWNAYQIGLNKSLIYRLDIADPGRLIPVAFPLNKN